MGKEQLSGLKTAILCGGRGTRLGEHGRTVPKALVQIGGDPVIWHLMQHYAQFGVTKFVLCLGYLGDAIRQYFSDRGKVIERNDTTIRVSVAGLEVELAETGLDTNTGGRIARVRSLLEGGTHFSVTYGDGLSDVPIDDLYDFHLRHGKAATLTAVRPVSSFGLVDINDAGGVERFREKPVLKEWVNGGFFIFGQEIFEHLSDADVLEQQPLADLAASGELMAYRHEGFWKCMDTYKDSLEFEKLWADGAPWLRK